MSTPDNTNSTYQAGILTAQDLVAWKAKQSILKIPTPPSKVIISPQLKIVRSKKQRFSSKEIKGLVGMHLCVDRKSGVYLSGGWGIGGPALVAVCEELHALGATEFYLLGLAGRLSGDIEEGDITIATSAIREEGTSVHYLPTGAGGEVNNHNPAKITKLAGLLSAKEVKFVTTDAPYRETPDKYKDWYARGAKIIDMETASLYAFSNFYSIQAASIGIGADSLMNGKWTMANNYSGIENKLSVTIDKLIEILK